MSRSKVTMEPDWDAPSDPRAGWDDEQRFAWSERAAIMELCGGMTREAAELAAEHAVNRGG